MMKAPIVISHGHCVDGFTAAWIIQRALLVRHPMPAEVIFAEYNDPAPDVTGRDVYIVDFSYSRGDLERMHDQAERLVVLDHHATAATALAGLPYCVFDKNESGAALAWRYMHGNSHVPDLVRYVRDYDLWRFELPDSKAVHAWIGTQFFNFANWDEMSRELSLPELRSRIVYAGESVLASSERVIENHIEKASEIDLGGITFLACNATTQRSGIGGVLCRCSPSGAAAIWFLNADGSVHWSLRADKTKRVDVRFIAEQFDGGGGHPTAAGFKLSWAAHFRLWSSATPRQM